MQKSKNCKRPGLKRPGLGTPNDSGILILKNYEFHTYFEKVFLREKQRGGETQRGKHTIKPLPKNVFGPPHLYDTIPPPLCLRNVILLRGNGHRPDKSHFLRPPKLVLEGGLYGTFPPQKVARYVLPPPLRMPNFLSQAQDPPKIPRK